METGTGTVLLVEDDRAMRLLCRVNLELEGYHVLEAPTLETARNHLAGEQVDAVVLDVHVAGESGLDLIGEIREKQASIALLTGSAVLDAEQRARADTVLAKPFEPEDLTATIGRLM